MLDELKKEILPHSKECCDSDWDKIFDTMQRIFTISDKARREGILAVEDGYMPYYDEDDEGYDVKDTFSAMLRMVLDGLDSCFIEEFATSTFYSNNFSHLEAFLFLIDASGLLYVQAGRAKSATITLFKGFVPFDYRDKIYDAEEKKFRDEAIEKFKQRNFDELFDFVPMEDFFSKTILQLSDRQIQMILRDIDTQELEKSFKYTTAEIIKKILGNMSSRAAELLYEDFVFLGRISEDDCNKAKMKILSTLNRLSRDDSFIKAGGCL